MNLKFDKTVAGTVLVLEGMLDSSSYDEFNDAVSTFLSAGEPDALTVDMTDLEYVSSRGIRAVLTLIKKMSALGKPLKFKGVNPALKEIFDLSGIGSIMEFV